MCFSSWGVCSEAKYDEQIQLAWKRFIPEYSWHIGWGQLKQESNLRENAKSPVGAEGLAQFMPATWSELRGKGVVPPTASPRDARWAIHANAYYMRQMLNIWKSKRTATSRMKLALASYNGGAGDLIRAQKLCGMAVEYDDIAKCIPRVKGKHAAENLGYEKAIRKHIIKRWGYDPLE